MGVEDWCSLLFFHHRLFLYLIRCIGWWLWSFSFCPVPCVRYWAHHWLSHNGCLLFDVVSRFINIWLVALAVIVSILIIPSGICSHFCFYFVSVRRSVISTSGWLFGLVTFSWVGGGWNIIIDWDFIIARCPVIWRNRGGLWSRRYLDRWDWWLIFGTHIITDTTVGGYLSPSILGLLSLLRLVLNFPSGLS